MMFSINQAILLTDPMTMIGERKNRLSPNEAASQKNFNRENAWPCESTTFCALWVSFFAKEVLLVVHLPIYRFEWQATKFAAENASAEQGETRSLRCYPRG